MPANQETALQAGEIGELHGPVLLYGGAYSNLAAMQALVIRAEELGIAPENRICTGDLVGYCAHPDETVALARRAGGHIIAGNCERQLAGGAESCGCGFESGGICDRASQGWYGFARETLAPEHTAWTRGLPDLLRFRHAGRRGVVLHGGATQNNRFLWPDAPASVFRTERAALEARFGPVDLIVAGHAGIGFQREVDGCLWLNAGAIGLPPHDGRAATRYALLTGEGAVIHRLDYDPAPEVAAMVAAGLTQGYERTLTDGLWPSEEILPPALRHQV